LLKGGKGKKMKEELHWEQELRVTDIVFWWPNRAAAVAAQLRREHKESSHCNLERR